MRRTTPALSTPLLATPLLATLVAGWSATGALAQVQTVSGDGERAFVWSNGDAFSGAFRDGRPNGPGSFRAADGRVHSGAWRDGCLLTPDGHRIAVFTRLRDCPPLPVAAARRRNPSLPLPDFR